MWGWLTTLATNDVVLRPAARYAFDRVDVDKNGEISPKELQLTLEYLSTYVNIGFQPTEEQMQCAVALCDKDQSGGINYEEFVDFLHTLSNYTVAA